MLGAMPNENAVALVTGGAKRVGRAVVLGSRSSGTTSRSPTCRAPPRRRTFAGPPRRSASARSPIRADLSDPPAAAEAIDREVTAWSARLDVLVNNASLWLPARLADTTPDVTRKVWAVHVESPLLLCQRFAGRLRRPAGTW
jgi:NAD(P)-dependent dehydrogenase (short-subunit alcohol dehydrogenase family)